MLPPKSARQAADLLGEVIAAVLRMRQRTSDASPDESVSVLAAAGALLAPLPCALGGLGLATEPEGAMDCVVLLAVIGQGSLPLGRVYQAHVKAARLLARFGDAGHHQRLRRRLQAGAPCGSPTGTRRPRCGLIPPPGVAAGGAARVLLGRRPCHDAVMIAAMGDSPPRLLWLPLNVGETIEPSAVDFTGVCLPNDCLFGAHGDYMRESDKHCLGAMLKMPLECSPRLSSVWRVLPSGRTVENIFQMRASSSADKAIASWLIPRSRMTIKMRPGLPRIFNFRNKAASRIHSPKYVFTGHLCIIQDIRAVRGQ